MTTDDRPLPSPTLALTRAAEAAGYAPSIHNTQPWHWRVTGDVLELHTAPARQLRTSDPDGRLMVLSCGAALHHARTALAAEGWTFEIDRLPDPSRPTLLARIRAIGQADTDPHAMRHLQTTRIRHTDRRPVSGTPVETRVLDAVRSAVEGEHSWLHLMRREDVLDLAAAAGRAQTLETFDPQWRDEMAYWAGGVRSDGLGIPASAIPAETPQTTVPGRDFGVRGDLQVSAEHDGAASYGILFGPDDTPLAWLRGGESLSAGWLIATELGISLLPLSAAIEVDITRAIVRRLISRLGEPLLLMRLGLPDPDHAGPPHTPRLEPSQTIEVVA